MYPSFLYLATFYVAGVQSAGLPSLLKPESSSILGDVAASQSDLTDLPSLTKRQREDGRCGKGFDDAPCASNECCSAEGWCGQGYLYCSAPACQIDYGPACDANVRPKGVDTEGTRRTHNGKVPYGQGIYHCEKLGAIALTYDDGPYNNTEDLLDILQTYQAKATFFITGNNLGKGAINDPQYAWASLIKRMIQDGHQVASHTWGHQRLTSLSQSQLRRQMIYNEIAIADIIGVFPTYMRPPYSASNDDTDSWLGDLGYHITYFNLDTEGYLHNNASAIQTSKDIWDKNVEGKDPQSIHFLQIEHDPVYQSVYNLTEYILQSMARNGLETVTVGECLNDPKKNWYRLPPNATQTEESALSDEDEDEDEDDEDDEDSGPFHTLPPTVDGRCGSAHKGQTCEQETVLAETCCSRYGWCGNTTAHCGVGCQPIYGTCD